MLPDPYAELDRACQQFAGKPLPAWAAHPAFDGLDSIDAIIDAARGRQQHDDRSDRIIRALATIGRDEPDALTVLLGALAPLLRARLRRAVTNEYRADVLTDLTFVVLDASERSDLELGTRLAQRLVNRAHNRAHKRMIRVRTRGVRRLTVIDPYPPDRLTFLCDRPSETDDVATLATARADLDRFLAAVREAVEAEQVPEACWTVWRDHRLAREFDPNPVNSSGRTRTDASRAARRLQPFIDHHLRGHAA